MSGWARPARPWAPTALLSAICQRSVDFLAQSEDLPREWNRVEVDRSGRIHLNWEPTGTEAHAELVTHTKKAIRRAAVLQRIPTITTMAAARAAAEGIEALQEHETNVYPLQHLHAARAAAK